LISIYAADEEYEKIQQLAERVKSMEVLELFEDYLVGQPGFSQISGTYTNPWFRATPPMYRSSPLPMKG